MEPSVVGVPWSRARLVGFRLVFCYLVIVNAPFPFGVLPWTEKVAGAAVWPIKISATWLAKHALGLGPIVVEFNGSGDRTLDYIIAAERIALAILAAAIWSLVQRRARDRERLLQWLRLQGSWRWWAASSSSGGAR